MKRLLLILALVLTPMLVSAAVLAEETLALAGPQVMDGDMPCHGESDHKPQPAHATHGGASCAASCALAGFSVVQPGGQVIRSAGMIARQFPAVILAPSHLSWPPPLKPPRA